MSIHKKISLKAVVLIIGICVVVGLVIGFFLVSKCKYSPSLINPNWLTDQAETKASRLNGCYFKWQCQFIENEEGQEVCNTEFSN